MAGSSVRDTSCVMSGRHSVLFPVKSEIDHTDLCVETCALKHLCMDGYLAKRLDDAHIPSRIKAR